MQEIDFIDAEATNQVDLTEDVAIEELDSTSGAGTTNCGGTTGTASCPAACVGTWFCFT